MAIITQRILIISAVFLLTSCTNTQEAWNKHDPNEYLKVQGPASIEEDIKARGVDYFCQSIAYSSEGHEKTCYVERSSAEKVEEWNIRLAKTSFAVVKDATQIVIVVGYLALQAALSSQ